MRRRINQLVYKVLNCFCSSSSTGLDVTSDKGEGLANAASLSGLGDGLQALRQSHEAAGDGPLKKTIGELLDFIGSIDNTTNSAVLKELDADLSQLSSTILSMPPDDSSSHFKKKIDDLTSDISGAIDSAQNYMPKVSVGGSSRDVNDVTSLARLHADIQTAIEKFYSEPSALPGFTVPDSGIKKSARFVSGRVAGALKIAKESLDSVPVPGLKAAVGGFLEVLTAVNKLIDNSEELAKLIDHIQRLIKIVTPPAGIDSDQIETALQQRFKDLTVETQLITADAEKLRDQNLANKFFGSADNAAAIEGLIRSFNRAVDRFQVAGGIWVEKKIGRLEQGAERLELGVGRVEDGILVLGENLTNRLARMEARSLSAVEQAALGAIQPRADTARYNSSSQTMASFCLPNTRVALLNEIFKWASDPNSPLIFWLSGMAGTGKSTIARTVAKSLDDNGLLGATFFFSRDEADRQSTARVFTTIAYQLARSQPTFRNQIVAAANIDVCTAMMQTQVEKLIVEPLKTVTDAIPAPIVIIFDALDECSSENQIAEMIILVSLALRDLRPHVNLKVVVTSRPETHIRGQFMKPTMRDISSIFHLHEIDKSVVSDDIHQYLDHHLTEIRNQVLSGETFWPKGDDVKALVRMADGLFIYASVAVAYIRHQPVRRMKILLSGAAHQKAAYAYRHLDALYHQILKASELQGRDSDDPKEVITELHMILSTIVILLDPLSTKSLELLLKLEEGTVKPHLKPFHSLLSIPDSPYPVHIFHKSFPDFLMDKQRSGDNWYYIDTKRHQTQLALLCIDHMNSSLKQDMCGLGDLLNSEIENKEELLETKVQPHLLYACQYWGSHLKAADHTRELDESLHRFTLTKLLCWLEILSLLDKVYIGVHLLDLAKEWCTDATCQSILHDCYRFLLYFQEAISIGPSHIYKSALPFIPQCDFFKITQGELQNSVKVIYGQDTQWSNNLFNLKGHSDGVTSVAFSPDGSQIASSSHDHKVAVWDAKNGALISTLKGHTDGVASVVFSPDGSHIASGSYDMTIVVWDAKSGAPINTLRGHSDWVTSISFSPDGSKLASGSNDLTVAIWEAESGVLIKSSEGHSDSITSVSFSPDGSQIASCGYDNTVALWDGNNGALISILKGHLAPVMSVVFSPNGAHIASGSYDLTVAIWDAKSGALINSLKGQSYGVSSVAFSPDGSQIASGSYDMTVALWNSKSGALINTFQGHTDGVASVAFSPDGLKIASGCHDMTVAVWDASATPMSIAKGHSDRITSFAFSPDGSQVASSSYDMTVAIWDAKNGIIVNTLKGHSDGVMAVAFSPDGLMIASGSNDKTVIIWDVKHGTPIHTLQGHSAAVTSVTFSADGSQIASGSVDNNVGVWDARTGALVTTLHGHSNVVTSVSFSLDGLFISATGLDNHVILWNRQNFEQCTKDEQSHEVNSKPYLSQIIPEDDGLFLDNKWIMLRTHGALQQLCILMIPDIVSYSSFKTMLVFGTRQGNVYILDFSSAFPNSPY